MTVARIDPLYVETFLPIRYFGLISREIRPPFGRTIRSAASAPPDCASR